MVLPSQLKDWDEMRCKEKLFNICKKGGEIGSSYSDVLKVVNSEIRIVHGWAKAIGLPSKWIVGFNHDERDRRILRSNFFVLS